MSAIEAGDMVVVVSIYHTSIHNGRKSQYDIGDCFVVESIDEDGTLKDNNYNFVNINDVELVT